MPGSQDSVTRGVQNLQISDTPASQTAPAHRHRRCPTLPRPRAASRIPLVCAMWPDPAAVRPVSDHGLILHMVQKHGGRRLLPESVAQLRNLESCSLHQVATMSLMYLLRK